MYTTFVELYSGSEKQQHTTWHQSEAVNNTLTRYLRLITVRELHDKETLLSREHVTAKR